MEQKVPSFVKKFDFRGVYGKDIKDEDAFYLASALFETFHFKKVLVGWDTRDSSKNLALSFIQGLESKNVEIYYLEKAPIDFVTAAAYIFDFGLSVMFTGSHNSWDWSGLLIHTEKGVSLQGDIVGEVVEKYYKAAIESFIPQNIDLSRYKNFEQEVEKVYAQKILSLIPLHEIRPMEIVVDIGDGSGSKSLDILEGLLPQVRVTRLNDRQKYDADTPHTADPSNVENMQQVIEKTKSGNFSAGFAFDSDADRVLAVDENGVILNGSTLGSALVGCLTMLGHSESKIGYAVECGPSLYNTVVDLQKSHYDISPVPLPVGRSLVRQIIRVGTVDIGVENVGHFYLKDFFMTDSGAFMIAVILYWITMNGSLSKLPKLHQDGQRVQSSVKLDEVKPEWEESIIKEITEKFAGRDIKKIEVDGVRYEIYNDGKLQSWCAFRKSGYEPILKYYYGSLITEDFDFMKHVFEEK
jgi:phosphomannomutase